MESTTKDLTDLKKLRIERKIRKKAGSRVIQYGLILLLLLILSITTVYFARSKAPDVTLTTIRLLNPSRNTAILNASGYVTPRRRATVASKITGQVKAIFVEEGMAVDQDQVLAVLDQVDAGRELDAAKADLNVAKASVNDLKIQRIDADRQLNRMQSLIERNMISRQELDAAQTTRDSLNARIELANKQVEAAAARVQVFEQMLDNYTIRAPFAGIIVSKDAQIGEMVSPISAGGGYTRTGIATIVDMDSLEIEVDVNESYIARVFEGQPVTATLDAYPEWEIPASVRTVIPTADRQKATVKVRISFDHLDPRILPDMGVKVSFLDDSAKDQPEPGVLLVVDKDAVFTQDGNTYVFLYRDGFVERRRISIGSDRSSTFEVLSGVMEGDRVVNRPPEELTDGGRVALQK